MACHNVTPEVGNHGERILESSSPDEISFIEFLEKIGYRLVDKTDEHVSYTDASGKLYQFEIIETFQFTSSRARMGIIVRYSGKIIYLLKGADSRMIPLLKESSKDKAAANTKKYSKRGLRTLILAEKVLEEDSFNIWRQAYKEASASMTNREDAIEKCVQRIETDMHFLGVTAVEDLLQDEVRASIRTLRDAGIKVWMLTGDKLETAKSISITTGLYHPDNDILYQIKDVDSSEQMKVCLMDLLKEIEDKKKLATNGIPFVIYLLNLERVFAS